MLQHLLEFLKGVVYIIIGVCEYIYTRLSLLNPGTQWGIGVAGFIGLIGFLLRLWVWTTGIVVCLLGGFIGSGMYKADHRHYDAQSTASEERMFAVLSGSGILQGSERGTNSTVRTYR